jgi:hypothetical protein
LELTRFFPVLLLIAGEVCHARDHFRVFFTSGDFIPGPVLSQVYGVPLLLPNQIELRDERARL